MSIHPLLFQMAKKIDAIWPHFFFKKEHGMLLASTTATGVKPDLKLP